MATRSEANFLAPVENEKSVKVLMFLADLALSSTVSDELKELRMDPLFEKSRKTVVSGRSPANRMDVFVGSRARGLHESIPSIIANSLQAMLAFFLYLLAKASQVELSELE